MAAIAEINRQTMAAIVEDADFKVLSLGIQNAHWARATAGTGCPLMVIVHPGDAVEAPHGWAHADYKAVHAFSMGNQAGMASEIEARLTSHEVVVLHRSSSSELLASRTSRWVDRSYAKAVRQASERGSVAYGDDLCAAANWIRSLTELSAGRDVFMTGAYADAKYGCITALGAELLAVEPRLLITVSEYAPTDNSNYSPRWVPQTIQDQTSHAIETQSSRVKSRKPR